jgi:hypothetical protein
LRANGQYPPKKRFRTPFSVKGAQAEGGRAKRPYAVAVVAPRVLRSARRSVRGRPYARSGPGLSWSPLLETSPGMSSPRRRGSSTPRFLGSSSTASATLDRPVEPGNGRSNRVGAIATRETPFSRRHRVRALLMIRPPNCKEGAGKAGCSPHPWPACRKKAGGSHHRSGRNNRPSPRDGLTTYTYSPRCAGLVSHRPCATLKASSQVGASVGAPGPYDFAVLPRSVVRPRYRAPTRNRPPHPALNVRDDRETPLL